MYRKEIKDAETRKAGPLWNGLKVRKASEGEKNEASGPGKEGKNFS